MKVAPLPVEIATSPLLKIIRETNARSSGDQKWEACCPAHDDRTASLCISKGDKHDAVLFCQAGCTTEQVLAAIGMKMSDLMPARPMPVKKKIVAKYDYVDESGSLEFQVVRFEPKDFRQRKPKPGTDGGWIWSRKGTRDVLYRLPEVQESDLVFLVEGEKDADNAVEKLGIPATTNAGGAKKFRKHHAEQLQGKKVVLIPDNDTSGEDHTVAAARLLDGIATSVKLVRLPGIPAKGDLSDWIRGGGTAEDLQTLADDADEFDPSKGELNSSKGEPVEIEIDEAADDPHRLARINLANYEKLGRKLAFWNSEWWRYKEGTWRRIDIDELKAKLSTSIRSELEKCWLESLDSGQEEGPPPPVKKVTRAMVANVVDATASLVVIPSSVEMPCWLPDRSKPTLLSFENGLFNLDDLLAGKDEYFADHASEWFDSIKLNFPFDLNAECDNWLSFLDEVFEGDQQQITALQKWFGYCLTNQTHLQKILFILGPKRSGKGTIIRILTGLLGEENVCSPTLAGLTDSFGLHPLVGRKVATIADARLSGKADSAIAVERLLSISGEDRITINRKHKDAITKKLDTRIVIVSNELPRLNDASGALASRMICLETPKSFFGNEDFELTNKLMVELPGIFLWAITGLLNLRTERKISQPESGKELIDELTELSSPVSAFVADCCELNSESETSLEDLYLCYLAWSKDQGRKSPQVKSTFSRDLKAYLCDIERKRKGRKKSISYEGIGLVQEWRIHLAGLNF